MSIELAASIAPLDRIIAALKETALPLQAEYLTLADPFSPRAYVLSGMLGGLEAEALRMQDVRAGIIADARVDAEDLDA